MYNDERAGVGTPIHRAAVQVYFSKDIKNINKLS
jgi:hypothetical protein